MNETLKINEIFYSIQGEGEYTGVPMVFIRFSGCNMHCAFCDTDHSQSREMTVDQIIKKVQKYPCKIVLLTGGEPTIQPIHELLKKLTELHYTIHLETNGSTELSDEDFYMFDWITVSPKKLPIKLKNFQEVKVVYEEQDMTQYDKLVDIAITASLQPCDYGDIHRNRQILKAAIKFVMEHPDWRLSLQTHKMIGIK